jgi:ABC-2 type transport system permease protein
VSSLTAFRSHFSFEFKTGLRNRSLLLMYYLFPLGFYVAMGLVMTQLNPVFVQTMIPAMVVLVAMTSALLGLPSPLVESREAGIFRSYRINGVPALTILLIPVLTTIVHSLIASGVIVLTGPTLFKGEPPLRWGAFVGITLLTITVFSSLGILIGVVSASSRGTILWSQLIFLPSMLLGGLMVPLSLIPESIRPVALLLPASWSMQAFTALAYGRPAELDPLLSLVVLGASAVLGFGLAVYLFDWDRRNSSRRGHPVMGLLVMLPYVLGLLLR